MDHFGASLELKTVDLEQRIISGHAAAHSNLDRVKDIIDPQASAWAVKDLGHPSNVAVFIGHQHDALPMGIPIKIESTPDGLYTETLIKPGVFGDDLLQTARFLQQHGQPLGMSIGYQTVESKPDRAEGKMVRRITKYRIKEFSYAANQTIANPKALVTSVKQRKAMSEGSDRAGGALVPDDDKADDDSYSIEQRGDRFHVLEGDGSSLVNFATRVEAAAALTALTAGSREDAGEDQTDDTPGMSKTTSEVKATWTGAYVDSLPNSSFLFVEPGEDDTEGKRVPRSKRHLPYKDAEGKLDTAHLRAAISRLGQPATLPGLDDAKKHALQARARKMLEDAGSGKAVDEDAEWKTGAPLAVRYLAYQLLDLSDRIAGEQKAMALLGEDTKDYYRIRGPVRDELKAIGAELAKIVSWSATIDAGQDEAAKVAWYRARLQLATG